MKRRILLVPSVFKGNGSGHLVRCFSLARELGSGTSIFIAEGKNGSTWTAAELSLAYSRELAGTPLITELTADQRWDLVVLDRRAMSAEEVAFWERLGPAIAIDEGGPARLAASYLIDVLPRANQQRIQRGPGEIPNRASLGFLNLPKNRRTAPQSFKKVLVSFGGEDPAGLSLLVSRILISEKLVKPADLTLVSGALRRGAPPIGLDGATVLGPVQDLKEHLALYDLVITEFGLTAYEAAWAGCGVILLNPSLYHQSLARTAGFPEAGVGRPELGTLKKFFFNPASVLERCEAIAPREQESLSGFIQSISPSGPRACPRCGSLSRRVLFRNEQKSYFRCRSCGLIYLERFFSERSNPYKKAYFFDEYKKQYGKSYLDDWSNLSSYANSRLDIIEAAAEKGLGRRRGLSMLDVGCAYGPFLAAARDRGQEVYGLDISEDAAAYVRQKLGIAAAAGDFLKLSTASSFGGPFDVLSMWYVIEHFIDLDQALRNAAALVRPGGVLAFSTPSGEGVSARYNRQGFFEHSPEDHFTIWEPSTARGILKAYGFRVERIRITGHHPERFPLPQKVGGKLRKAALGLCGAYSRIFGLGDTFEVYAVRENTGASLPNFGRNTRRERVGR